MTQLAAMAPIVPQLATPQPPAATPADGELDDAPKRAASGAEARARGCDGRDGDGDATITSELLRRRDDWDDERDC